MGTTRSANGPTHGEVTLPFACFPCFMITVPFVLNHYSSKYWYKKKYFAHKSLAEKAKTSKYPQLAF